MGVSDHDHDQHQDQDHEDEEDVRKRGCDHHRLHDSSFAARSKSSFLSSFLSPAPNGPALVHLTTMFTSASLVLFLLLSAILSAAVVTITGPVLESEPFYFENQNHLMLSEDCCSAGDIVTIFRLNSSSSAKGDTSPFLIRFLMFELASAASITTLGSSAGSSDAAAGAGEEDADSRSKGIRREEGADESEDELTLDPRTGFLSLSKPFDYERKSAYKFKVIAAVYQKSNSKYQSLPSTPEIDSTPSPASLQLMRKVLKSGRQQVEGLYPVPLKIMSQEFTIDIRNENDEAPVIKGNYSHKYHYRKDVPEDIEPDSFLLRIEAHDPDSDSGLTYVMPDDHSSQRYFDLNTFSGELRTKILLDREAQEMFHIPVYIFDSDHKHMTQANVLIVLLDKNEHAPEFTGCSASSRGQVVQIPEDIPTGTSFHRVIASDRDLLPSSITIPGSDDDRRDVWIAETTAAPAASSLPSSQGEHDANKLPSPPSVGVAAGSRTAAAGAGLSYRIMSGNEANAFSLNPLTGEILTLKRLDREETAAYDLLIESSDSLFTASCSLRIELLDINDNYPVFDRAVYSSLINVQGYANLNQEKEVLTVRAADPDLGDEVFYTLNATSVTRSDAQFFSMNSTSGVISANLAALIQAQKGSRDRNSILSRSSTFTFQVFALDSKSTLTQPYVTNATVHVTFTHTIESTSPRLKHYPYIIELDAHRNDFRIGAQVGQVEFGSLGSASTIRIEVEDKGNSNRCSDYFNIDSKTGSVTVKRNLNSNFYECFLSIKGSEDAAATSSLLQLFFLRGISSEAKSRKANAFSLQVDVSETTAVGSQIVNLITRSRMPSLRTGQHLFTISYSSLDPSYFDLEPATGVIFVKKQLDHELLPATIDMVAVAKKIANPFENPIFFNIVISILNVNDNPPQFSQNHYSASVFEGKHRGTFVAPVFALDLDTISLLMNAASAAGTAAAYSADANANGLIKYHIEDGNVDNAFLIDASTGLVKTNTVLDREIRSHYLLKIVATDQEIHPISPSSPDGPGIRRLSSECLLEINVMDVDDNVPVFPPSYELSVKEDAKIGSVITTLTANDVDTFPRITYRLKDKSDTDHPFDIELYTGKMILTSAMKSVRRSGNSGGHLKLKVLASDSFHTIETEVALKTKKGDVFTDPPSMTRDYQFVQVDPIDNNCVGSGGVNCQIARVDESINNRNPASHSPSDSSSSASDPHARAFRILYRIEYDPSSSFYIDSATGVLYNNRSLKLPANKLFSVHVIAGFSKDGKRFLNHLRSRASLLISVLKSETVEDFSESDFNVLNVDSATDEIGSVLLSLPLSRKYSYRITSGNAGGEFVLLRNIHLTRIKPGFFSSYKLEIEGTLRKQLGSSVKFIVNVKIVKEGKLTHTPKVFNVKLPEDTQPSHDVISVSTDLDYGNQLRYVLVTGNERDDFRVDPLTGLISVNQRIEYERCSYYQLAVSVQRRTDHTEVALALVNIHVIKVPDPSLMYAKSPSSSSKSSIKASIKENMPIGTRVVKIPDFHPNQYHLVSTNSPSTPFVVDQETGFIVTTEVIDYETTDPPFYMLSLKPSSLKRVGAEISVEIEIDSVDEYPPKFNSESYHFNATVYFSSSFMKLGRVHASDRDSGPDGRVLYSIRSSSPNSALNKFIIDSSTGIISLSSLSTDDFPPNQCSLIVMASSGKEGSLTALSIIQISLRLGDGSDSRAFDGRRDDLSVTPVAATQSPFSGWPLFFIILLMLLTVVLLFSIVVIRLYQQQQQQESMLSGMGSSACSFDMNTLLRKRVHSTSTLNVTHPHAIIDPTFVTQESLSGGRSHYSSTTCHTSRSQYVISTPNGPPPPCYSQITNVSSATEGGGGTSASSGRGSAEEADEEIRMIIAGNESAYYVANDGEYAMHDEEEEKIPTTAEYLARLGVADHSGDDLVPPLTLRQVNEESEQQQLDHDDIASENLGELNPRSKNAFSSVRSRRDRKARNGRSRRHRNRDQQEDWSATLCGSVNSVIQQNQEELSVQEAYNWNYLQHWGPKYQPMTAVFHEIARLKGQTLNPPGSENAAAVPQSYRHSPLQDRSFLSRLETASNSSQTGNTTVRWGPRPAPRTPSSSHSHYESNVSDVYQQSLVSPPSSSGGSVIGSNQSAFSPVRNRTLTRTNQQENLV